MKTSHITRRLLCLLLAVVLVASLFAGLTLTAFAVPSLPSANTRVRHIVCTSLSSQATAYYGSGQYSYAQMSQLSGVNNAEDCWATTQNNPLYTRLQTLMSSTQTYTTTYSGTSSGSLAYYWEKTDAQNSSSTYYCFYSDLLYGSSGFPSDMQREHIWPKSNASFYQTNGGSDLHHLRPSVGSLNNSKSNKSFGEMTHDSSNTKYVVSGDESTVYYSGTYFEPKDDIKGDVARILLYVYCRWGQPNLYTDVASSKLPAYDSDDSANNGTRAIDGRDILLKWLKNDPVDTWEMERNDRVQNVQGNRNVFIDYPEYAWLVFGLTPPSDMTTPSGMAENGGTPAYTVTPDTNNSNWGTVSISGSVITATPATGYYASGYQVTSGSATVAQNGNTFTVTPTSNCTVQIIFAPKTTVTMSYFANGSSYNPGSQYTSVYAGDEFTLPATATEPSGWTFVGWTTNGSYTDDTTAPTIVTTCTPTGATSFYAVYSQTSGSGGTTNVYVSTAAAKVDAGQYVIGALRSDSATNNYYFATSTVSSGDINTNTTTLTVTGTSFAESDLPSGAVVFTFTGDNTNGFTIAPSGTTNYLGFTAASNRKLAFDSAYSTTKWQAVEKTNALNTNGLYLNCTSGTTYAISENSTAVGAIRGYASGTAYRGIYLFKLTSVSSGTTTYSINPSGASHEHTMSYTAANAASCTAAGNIAYYYCSGCGKYFADNAGNTQLDYDTQVVTAALGHNYVAGTAVAPTAGSAGYTPYTCSRCGDSYNGDYTYLLTFVGPTGTTTQTESANNTATLPSLTDYNGWTFAGWVKNTYDNTTTAPTETVYTTSYPVTNESVTFYALYTKTETDTGATTPSGYKLSDSAPAAGESVIIALKSGSTYYALPHVTNGQTPTSLSGTALTISDGIVSNYSDVTWTVAATNNSSYPVQLTYDSSYYFKMNSGKFAYTGTGSTGYLAFASVSGGGYTVSNANSTTRYLASSSTSFTVSNNSTDAVTVYIFKYEEGTTGTQTTTYTTQFNTSCTHPNMQSTAANAATCTAAGNSAYYTCPDCGKYFSDAAGNTEIAANSWVIPASGHDYQDTVTPATCTAQGYTTHVCSRCDDTTVDTYVAALGHNYESAVTTPATCVNDGVRTYTCSRCQDSYTETILATGEHSYESAVTTPATCGQAGVMTYTCSVCGASYTEEIPATGNHDYQEEVTLPTASSQGFTMHTCSVCGDYYTDNFTQLLTFIGPESTTTQVANENSNAPLPSLGDYDGWTFSGWVLNTYDNTTTAPTETVYTTTYPVTNSGVTFYALYTKTEGSGSGGTPTTTYDLVSSAADVTAGEYVIASLYNEVYYHFPSETAKNPNPAATANALTVSNDKLTNTVTDDMLWTFTGDNTNGFAITHEASDGTTYYLGAYNAAQGILVDTTGATASRFYSWKASDNGDNGGVRLKCSDTGSRYLSIFVNTSGTATWRYYATVNGAPLLFKKTVTQGSGSGTTTTYTTQFAAACTHDDMEYVDAQAPTCDDPGHSAYYYCPDCGRYFEDAQGNTEIAQASTVIAATGHDYGAWTHVANSDPSQHQRVCATDNSHIETAACAFGEGTVTVEPSYTSAGVRTYTCPDCGYSYTETIPALEYNESASGTYELLTDLSDLDTGDKVVIYNPTNTKAMTSTLVNTYYLSGADATISGTTLTPADETVVWTVTKNQDGTYTFTQENDVALYGYVSGSYVDLAVASGEGYINKWSVSEVDSTNHKYSILCDGLSYTKSSTTYDSVYLEYFNSRFALYGNNNALTESDGAYLMQFYVYQEPAIEVKGVNLVLDGEINTNAYIAIPDSVVADGVTPVVTYVNANNQTVTVSTGDALTVADKTNGMYKFTARMPAKDMKTTVTVQLLDANNQPIGFLDEFGNPIDSYEYSVQDYLQTVINAPVDQTNGKSSYEKAYPGLTDLCKAMSNYGRAAQLQQEYNTNNLMNYYSEVASNITSLITSLSDPYSDPYKPSTSAAGAGITAKTASVVMLSETAIRVYFTTADKNATYYAYVTLNGSEYVDADTSKKLYSATRYQKNGANTDLYMVEIRNIAAKDLDEGFTVTLADQPDVESATNKATVSNYSVYSYIRQTLKNNPTPTEQDKINLVNVVKALYDYGQKAAAFFENRQNNNQ